MQPVTRLFVIAVNIWTHVCRICLCLFIYYQRLFMVCIFISETRRRSLGDVCFGNGCQSVLVGSGGCQSVQDGSNNLRSFCHKRQFGAGVLQNPSANLPRLEGCKTPWSSILCWLAEIPANLYYLAEPLSSKNSCRFPAANKFAGLASLGKPDLRAEQQCLRGYPARPFCAVGLLRDLRVLPNNIGGMKSGFPQHPRCCQGS